MNKKITFVCTGNYYRSRFAEAYFNYVSDILSLGFVADSSGLAIHLADELAEEYGEISPDSRSELEKFGIPEKYYERNRKSLTAEEIESSDYLIAMDEEEHVDMVKERFPEYKKRFSYLKIKDIFDWKPEKTLSEIQKEVEAILNKIVETGDLVIK